MLGRAGYCRFIPSALPAGSTEKRKIKMMKSDDENDQFEARVEKRTAELAEFSQTLTTEIAATKRAEKIREEQRTRAQNYLDIAGVMLLVLNPDQTVALINLKGCEILGYSKEEIIGKRWCDEFLPARDRDWLNGAFGKLAAGEISATEYLENPVLKKTGEERLIAWHNTLLRDQSGKIIGTLSSGEDITVRRRAEEEVALLRKQLELERDYLREEVNEGQAFGEILGRSEALQRVLSQIELVAPTHASVLILGETGTGKELVARAIHKRSPRSDRTLVKVNCASIPRELFESEFFGHVKGAFTGALRDRIGRFELANGGSLFLDEVCEIPLELQSKLLRVLQEGEFERIGDESTRRVNVRVISATNRDIESEVEAGRFRVNLFYRLGVFPLKIPPLRMRRQDIAILAAHFVDQIFSDLIFPSPGCAMAIC